MLPLAYTTPKGRITQETCHPAGQAGDRPYLLEHLDLCTKAPAKVRLPTCAFLRFMGLFRHLQRDRARLPGSEPLKPAG